MLRLSAHDSALPAPARRQGSRRARLTQRLRVTGALLVVVLGATGCSSVPDSTWDALTDWSLDQLIELTDETQRTRTTVIPVNGELVQSELSAAETLATLPVKGRAPKTGYDREDQFGSAWADVDRNGCDTRNDMLARDLTETVRDDRCRVLTGVLLDPFTGADIAFVRGDATSAAVQIDHVVSLSDAWQTGAQRLSDDERLRLANDPLNLLAVDGPTNASKSDSNAASWLPPNSAFRCHYVARQVSVKAEYGLWITAPEQQAIAQVLDSCPEQPAYRSVLLAR